MNDDDGDETPDLKIANQKIYNLVKRLVDKGVCPCCLARALAFHASSLAACTMGNEEAAELFEDIVADLREDTVPAPDSDSPTIN
jgi:hypothetical protein